MKAILLKCLCLTALFHPFLMFGQEMPAILSRADIKAEKQVLRPGETTKITLYNFRDDKNKTYHANTNVIVIDRIIISCSAGLIMDGTEWNNPDIESNPPLMGNSKIFLLRDDDRIEFYYRAPLRSIPEVEIIAYNSTTFGPIESYPLETSEDGYILNKLKLKILLDTYLLLNYSEEKQVSLGSTTLYKHKINAVIRIDCSPTPIPNSLQVTDLKVLEINGIAERISSDEHLVSTAATAKTSAYNSLVMLNTHPEDGSLVGIIYTAVPLSIDWQGDEIPEGPPDDIDVGPVSKDERSEWGARWEGTNMADEFSDYPDRSKITAEEKQRIRHKQASLLMNFAETQVHPDFMVQSRNGENAYSGKGNWEDENKSGGDFYRKTFNWEIYIK